PPPPRRPPTPLPPAASVSAARLSSSSIERSARRRPRPILTPPWRLDTEPSRPAPVLQRRVKASTRSFSSAHRISNGRDDKGGRRDNRAQAKQFRPKKGGGFQTGGRA